MIKGPSVLFEKTATGLKRLLAVDTGMNGYFYPGKAVSKGYYDMSHSERSGEEVYVTTYRWNGTTYVAQKESGFGRRNRVTRMEAKGIMRVIFVTVVVFLTCGASAAQSNLPSRVRAYLDANYSGWKLSAVASGCPRDFKRSLVIGDFDGDKKRDYTVKFMSGQKGYIVAFLSRGTDYQPYVLEDGAISEMRSQGLSIARKGETYPEIVNDNFDRVTRRLQHDAPVGGTCESSAYLYIYRNGAFRRAFVSD